MSDVRPHAMSYFRAQHCTHSTVRLGRHGLACMRVSARNLVQPRRISGTSLGAASETDVFGFRQAARARRGKARFQVVCTDEKVKRV